MKVREIVTLIFISIYLFKPVSVTAYDISLSGSIHPDGPVRSAAVRDSTAFLAVGNRGLQIYSLGAPPSAPSLLKEYLLNNYTNPGGMLLRNSLIYLSGSGGIRIVDVSDPTSPTLKGMYQAPQLNMLATQGNLIFAARGGQPAELRILNLDNPTSLTTLATYPMSFIAGMAVNGSWLFIAGGNDDLIRVLDVTDPTSPTQRAAFAHPDLDFPTGLALEGDKLYFTCSLGGPITFGILDVSNPLAPALLGRVYEPGLSEGVGVKVLGNFAYLLDSWGGVIVIYDVANPYQPRRVISEASGLGSWVHGLIVDDLFIYAYGDQGMHILNYTVPVELSDFTLE